MTHSRTIILSLGALIFFGLCVTVVHEQFTTQVPGANDFYPRWKGAQLFFEEGLNPYSEEATAAIQMDMYGRLAEPDEDQVAFAYPFYTVFFIYPLVALNLSYSWAQAFWIMLVLLSLFLAMALLLRLLSWQLPIVVFAFTVLWGILSYNGVRTIVLGQFAGLVFLATVGCLLALQRGNDRLAGALLAVTTIKPQMSLFFVAALLLWALWQKRWRFLRALCFTLALFLGASTLLVPSWPIDFANQVIGYTTYTHVSSPIWVVTGYYFPQLAQVEIVASLLVLLYLAYKWRQFSEVSATDGRFLALIAITLLVSNLVIPRTATTNQIVLYLPILWLLKTFSSRTQAGPVLVALFLAASFVIGWLLFIETSAPRGEQPLMYLWLPGLTTLLIAGYELHNYHIVRRKPGVKAE